MLALEHLYDDPMCFGKDVFDRFEPANEDIAEAGKCLALDRATACVMHLNRALEVGLATLAASINVGPQKDWGSYIREINLEIETRAKHSDARFYAAANVIFDSMKRAYRNPTMHPEKRYSVEQAKDIFESTKTFMRHLATRLASPNSASQPS